MGATFKLVTTSKRRVKNGGYVKITKTTVYTCTELNAPHSCTFELTESKTERGQLTIVLTDAPTMFTHFVHQPSTSADGSFDLAIRFTSTGEIQPLLCKILCLPCMLVGC